MLELDFFEPQGIHVAVLNAPSNTACMLSLNTKLQNTATNNKCAQTAIVNIITLISSGNSRGRIYLL